MDEQTERIRENLKLLQDKSEETGIYSFQEFEDIFEDRDPFEFL